MEFPRQEYWNRLPFLSPGKTIISPVNNYNFIPFQYFLLFELRLSHYLQVLTLYQSVMDLTFSSDSQTLLRVRTMGLLKCRFLEICLQRC